MTRNLYQSPDIELDRPTGPTDWYLRDFRWLAPLLVLNGLGWGMLCAMIVGQNPRYAIFVLAPGYLVTAGYVWRTCLACPASYYKWIWGLSTLVQAFWLALLMVGGGWQVLLLPLWWLACSGILVMGLIWDGPWDPELEFCARRYEFRRCPCRYRCRRRPQASIPDAKP